MASPRNNKILSLESANSLYGIELEAEHKIDSLATLLAIHPANGSNEIELGNFLYTIGIRNFDISGYTITSNTTSVINGLNSNLVTMSTTDTGVDMVTATSNIFFYNIGLKAEGAGSQCIKMTGTTGFEAIDLRGVAFIGASKFGTLNGIRQAYWEVGFANGSAEGFTLQGTWTGGFTIFNSRIINVGSHILKGDTGFTCKNIRSNVNATIPAAAVAFDFDYDMITSDEGYQLEGGNYDGDGEMASGFVSVNTDQTDAEKSIKSNFKNNRGSKGKNTFVGGQWDLTTEVVTTISAINTAVTVEGTVTYSNMEHLGSTALNEFEHLSDGTVEYEIDGQFIFSGGLNDILQLDIVRWIDNPGVFINVKSITRSVTNVFGPNNEAIFLIKIPRQEMSKNDRIEFRIRNTSDTDNVTLKLGSLVSLSKKNKMIRITVEKGHLLIPETGVVLNKEFILASFNDEIVRIFYGGKKIIGRVYSEFEDKNGDTFPDAEAVVTYISTELANSDFPSTSSEGYFNYISSADYIRPLQTTEGLINNTNQFEDYLTLVVTPPRTGFYKISTDFQYSYNGATANIIADLEILGSDGSSFNHHLLNEEPTDVAGSNQTFSQFSVLLAGVISGNLSIGTDMVSPGSGSKFINLTQGVAYTIKLKWRCQFAGQIAAIHSGNLSCEEKTINLL